MKTLINKGRASFSKLGQYVHTKVTTNPNTVACGVGVALITLGMADIAAAQNQTAGRNIANYNYNQDRIADAVEALLRMIEGSLGALIMVVAGIGAIFAAAMGAYRAAVGMLVVAVGAFILRSLVTLFFGNDFEGVQKYTTTG